MPAKSEKQKRFFYLVKAVQQGKVSPRTVGSKVVQAAEFMSPQDVEDFTHTKPRSKKRIKEVVEFLKELQIEEAELVDFLNKIYDGTAAGTAKVASEGNSLPEERHVIAKTFNQTGNLDDYIKKFSGLAFQPMELEAVSNHTHSKPTQTTKFFIKYESVDGFNNNTTTIIKKLKDGDELVFTAFQSGVPQEVDAENPPENKIVVNKSISFRTAVEGGDILSDMLQTLEI